MLPIVCWPTSTMVTIFFLSLLFCLLHALACLSWASCHASPFSEALSLSQWMSHPFSLSYLPCFISPSITGITCQPFSVNNTNRTTQNYASCFVTAQPSGSANTLVISTLTGEGGSCSGDTYLRLYDADTGVELASNDDYEGAYGARCSKIFWLPPLISTHLELRLGCYEDHACSGTSSMTAVGVSIKLNPSRC